MNNQLITMTSLKVKEAILYAMDDYSLRVHLEFDFYNTLVRKRTNGTWDRQKAVMLIAKYFVPRIVKKYKKEIYFNATPGTTIDISGTTIAEKMEIADVFLDFLWEKGGRLLKRKPLKNVKKGDKNSLLVMKVSDLSNYENRERLKAF